MSGNGATKTNPAEAAFVSEVFHSLSQPLTALHCSLDLALRRDRTLKQLRASVQAALENAERLRQRLLLVRALNDASDPGDPSETTDLNAILRELCDDLSPLFESAGQVLELQVNLAPRLVRGERARLMRALLCFVEYLSRYSAKGARLIICCERNREQHAEMRIETDACLPVSPEDHASANPYSCEIEFVRRTLRAAGGGFELESCKSGHSVWRAKLPLA